MCLEAEIMVIERMKRTVKDRSAIEPYFENGVETFSKKIYFSITEWGERKREWEGINHRRDHHTVTPQAEERVTVFTKLFSI